jgi:hypothetical protein
MYGKRILVVTLGCLLLGSLVAATWPTWGLLYITSFESCKYTAGQPLVGQDGWVKVTDDASPNAAKVVQGWQTARSGRRTVECWGGDLKALPGERNWLLDGTWERLIDFKTPTRPAEVRVQADVKLIGPQTSEDLLSANLMARNAVVLGARRAPWFYLSSNGYAYANAHREIAEPPGYETLEYQFETPIRLGDWNRLAMILNYKTHQCTFQVNGKTIGSLPFGGNGEEFTSVNLELAAVNPDFEYPEWPYKDFQPELYKAYWDNIFVLAKPAR